MANPYPGQPPYPLHNGGPHVPSQGNGGAVPDSYFTESRKGEINELRGLLRGFASERDPKRKRDIIKKVIAYMTLGIDVSRLFSEMMLAIETRDLVIKKMVYLYLTNYARSHPELAQMCTNTLQKDCGNEDPMVRGLALRALCNLNLPQMVEYISEPLRRSLSDGHAYVRKTGVMGILKLFHLDADHFEMSGFVDILYDMLRDPDANVVCNCIIVLNEIMQKSEAGGMAINRAIMLHLLNRIHEFNEFAKVQVLELVPRYIPADEEEGYQIMNLLDPVLRTSSSGAVVATIRAFWSLAEHLDTSMQSQIVRRVKAPLVTQISSGSSEMMYSLLTHVIALVDMCPRTFDDEYRQFYVRYNEPTHVKYLKISILPRLANPDTAPDIVSELAELVSDLNPKLSRLAVRSMAKIACSGHGGPGAPEAIARRLVEMLDSNVDHVSSEASSALVMMLRKNFSLKLLIAPPLIRTLRYIRENSGKASILFLLGECGDLVTEAPYALEKMIDTYEDIQDSGVKLALMTTTLKLFFLRPPEVQQMLGRLLAKATNDVSSQDLHDRALLYYRMLSSATDPQTLETIVCSSITVSEDTMFAEDKDDDLRVVLMQEFNTLSIIYGKPSVNFISLEFQVKYVKMPESHPLTPDKDRGSEFESGSLDTGLRVNEPTLENEDFDFLGFGGNAMTAPKLSLIPSASLSGEEYQSQWEGISDKDSTVLTVPLPSIPSSADEIEAALASIHIMTMASGELSNEFKFFLYAEDSPSGSLFLIQSNIDKTNSHDPLMIVTIKVRGSNATTDQHMINSLIELMCSRLSS